MFSEKEFNWLKILWATVIIFALTLIVYVKYLKSNSEIGFDIYPYVIWPFVIGSTFVMMILRFLKIIKYNSFGYIFIGLVNTLQGIIGLYLNMTSKTIMGFFVHAMFFINILLALGIIWDVFSRPK